MNLVVRVLLALALAAPAAADVTDRLSRTVPLTPGKAVTLQVTTGQVRISGWNRPELAVEIVRRAPEAARLAEFSPQIDTTNGAVAIRVLQREGARDPALRSDVVVRVPHETNFREVSIFEGELGVEALQGTLAAHVERGDVAGRNISGVIRVETGMGAIRLERTTLSPAGLIRLRTFNGDVTLELTERPAHARVLALSMGGAITSDLPLTRQERWGPRWAETTIGNGDRLISIDVVNGNITLKVPQ
jgi:DUF4097 and DUF4098 domain-containing protein YvlB